MTTILLSWERGLNLGHISRMLSIANRLNKINHTPILSIPSDRLDNIDIINSGYKTVPGMDLSPTYDATKPVLSFASLLDCFGMLEKPYLLKSISHWKDIFTKYKVKAILLDYAVITHLAAYIFNVKAFQITDGFCAPTKDFPLFIGIENNIENFNSNKKTIFLLDKMINEIGFELTGKTDYTLNGYIDHVTKYYDTIPELDSYNQCTLDKSLSVLAGVVINEDIYFRKTSSKIKVFCYLRKTTYESRTVLQILAKNNVDTICFYPDDKVTLNILKTELKETSVFITDDFLNFNTLTNQSTHVISYGSSGTVTRACIFGKPQLIIPCDTQKQMVGRKALETQSAMVKEIGNEDMETLIDKFLSSEELKLKAKEFSIRYKDHDFNKAIESFINNLVA